MITRTQEIVDILKMRGATEDNPMTASSLGWCLGMSDEDPSNRSTRKAIRKAIEEGAKIGSNGNGYFILRNKKQCQKYLNSLMTQMVRLSERIALVHKAMQG